MSQEDINAQFTLCFMEAEKRIREILDESTCLSTQKTAGTNYHQVVNTDRAVLGLDLAGTCVKPSSFSLH